MAIKKQEYLYEVMLRFGPEGYEGAHQIWMDRYVDTQTSTVISEQQRTAEPLTKVALADLLDDKTVDLMAQITELKIAIEKGSQDGFR